MKKLFTLTLICLTGLFAWSQSDSTGKPTYNKRYSDYDNVSPWFFGLNVGATWHSTDVKNKLDYGFGATIGRTFLYKPGSPVTIDARLRYLRAYVTGQDYDTTSAVQYNPALNGTNYGDINYQTNPGFGVNNFQTDLHRASAELVLHYNKLREQKGIDLYAFGGVGLTFSKTLGDIKNGDSVQYDYGSLPNYDKETIDGLLDKSYESPLDGSSSKHSMRFMPSLGIGIGYQINPRFSLGLEHKTTFTGYDLFDGTNRDRTDFSVSGNKDIYHYTSFYLRFNFKQLKPRNIGSTNNNTNNITDPVENTTPITNTNTRRPPVVEIYDPGTSPYRTTQNYFNLRAKVYYVDGKSDIIFKQNGVVNHNFSFNPTTNEFNSHVALNPGQNLFEITATNEDGSFTDATVIILEVPNPIQPPIVTISNPSFSPYETSNKYFDLMARVLNVDTRNQVTVTLNGQSLSNFNFNNTTGNTAVTLALKEGQNIVTVRGVNQAGQDQKTVYIRYEKPQVIQPPVVDFITPEAASVTVEEFNYTARASVLNVNSKSQIQVSINGNQTNGFNYNHNLKRVELNTNLILGANVITIKATNSAGYDLDSRTVIYRKRDIQLPPVVTFLNPNVSPITSFANTYNVLARVDHVDSKNQITVKVNGIQTANFTFSPSSKQVNLNTSLVNGANIIEIQGVNNAGQDLESTTIIHKRESIANPPIVNITVPSTSPFNTYNPAAKVLASVLNVDGIQQISVKVNGVNTSNFTYNPDTKVLKINRTLVLGNNYFEITATNVSGSASDQTNIILKREVVPAPTAVWLNPASPSLTTHDGSYALTGKVTNVASASNVTVKKNGAILGQNLWAFNPSTQVVTLNTGLVLGNNVFELIATNSTGSASDLVNIIYEEEPCDNPVLSFVQPNGNNQTVDQADYNIQVSVQNASQDQISMKLNGVIVSGTIFNPNSNILSKNVQLNEGNNVIQVYAQNECGIMNASRTIIYVPQEEPCFPPEIQSIAPQNTISTYESSMNLSASLTNIEVSSQVQFKINGVVKPFTFDPATHQFNAVIAMPNIGTYSAQLIIENECGSTAQTWLVTKLKCANPIINITSHTGTDFTTEDEQILISGTVLGIENSNQIEVKHNGATVNFVFNAISKAIAINRTLTDGINQFVIRANNECGPVSKTLRITYNKPEVVLPPTVNFTSPNQNYIEVTNASYNVIAQITNIPNKSQLMVWVNGTITQNFNYNSSTGTVSIQRNLIIGDNTFKVRATNDAGMDQKTTVIKRNPVQIIPAPQIQYITPTSAVTNTSSNSILIKGLAKNITNPNDLTLYINNQLFTGYNTTVIGNDLQFEFTLPLAASVPQKIVRAVASNQSGTAEGSRTIRFKVKDKMITICHYPPGNTDNPQTIQIPESAWPAHQAHGDHLGPCETNKKPVVPTKKPVTPTKKPGTTIKSKSGGRQ